jgi:drug/metabolite transporter (DMT)-like permease
MLIGAAGLAGVMMLGSGLIHAVVNAILKSGGDKMSSRALIDGFSALIVLPFAFLLPPPTGAWMWLALSASIHLVYLIALVKAFEHGDMGVAYPIARGVAPALAAAVAVGAFHEPVTVWTAIGVSAVSLGVLTVGLGRAVQRRTIAWAGLTGVSIALYTVVDAQGVRAAPSAWSYIVWVFLALGGGIGVLFALWRGPRFIAAARAEWRPGLIAGALSIVTYGPALWALRLGATPRLAALRETSILFGLIIATVFLREKLTASRVAGVGVIAAGAVVLLAT